MPATSNYFALTTSTLLFPAQRWQINIEAIYHYREGLTATNPRRLVSIAAMLYLVALQTKIIPTVQPFRDLLRIRCSSMREGHGVFNSYFYMKDTEAMVAHGVPVSYGEFETGGTGCYRCFFFSLDKRYGYEYDGNFEFGLEIRSLLCIAVRVCVRSGSHAMPASFSIADFKISLKKICPGLPCLNI